MMFVDCTGVTNTGASLTDLTPSSYVIRDDLSWKLALDQIGDYQINLAGGSVPASNNDMCGTLSYETESSVDAAYHDISSDIITTYIILHTTFLSV